MKILLGLVFAAALMFIGYVLGDWFIPKPDPIKAIVTQMRTRAVIDHERWVSVWYRACPEATGLNPTMLVTWTGKLNYKLPLYNLNIKRVDDAVGKTRLVVKTDAIEVAEPTVPTDWIDALSTKSVFTLNEEELVDREKSHASQIARYLSQLYLKRDATKSIEKDMTRELQVLTSDLAGVLGLQDLEITTEVSTPEGPLDVSFPDLALCDNARLTVNGIPFDPPSRDDLNTEEKSALNGQKETIYRISVSSSIKESDLATPFAEPYGSVWFY